MTSLIPMYLKTTYKDEPLFQQAKTIYTLYNLPVDAPTEADFRTLISGEGVGDADLDKFDNGNFTGFAVGGAHYADASTVGDPVLEPELQKVLDESKLQLAYDFNGDDVDAYVKFYEDLFNQLTS
jgi:starch synthase